MLIRCHGGAQIEHKEERGRVGKLHRVEIYDSIVLML